MCIACFVGRGARAAQIDAFVRYHFALGVERIFCFFDEPHAPSERAAVDAARKWTQPRAAGPNAASCVLTLHLCDAEYTYRTPSVSP